MIQIFLSILFLLQATPLLAEVDFSQFANKWSGTFSMINEGESSHYQIKTSDQIKPSFIEVVSKEPFDLDGRFIRMKIRVNDLAKLSGIELRLSSDSTYENRIAIAIPLFTDSDFSLIQSGEWMDYTFTFGSGRIIGAPDINNIKHIGLYVEGKQTTGETLLIDLKDFKIESSILASVVSMTFDDGYDSQYDIAKIMAPYGLRGTAYVMTEQINLPGYLTLEQLQSLYHDYHWGVSAHHFTPITDMTTDQLSLEIEKTIDFLTQVTPTETSIGDQMISSPALHFAYPLGKQSRKTTLKIMKEQFLTARLASGGAESLPPADWHMLRAYNITNEVTPEIFAKRLDLAIQNNEWLILMFHKFTDEPTSNDPLVYPYSQFKEICEIIHSRGIPNHPVHEVFEALK